MPEQARGQQQHRRARARLVLTSAPLAAIFGAAAALAVYGVARSAGVSMLVPVDPRDAGSSMVNVGIVGVLISSVFPAFAGAIALALLSRTSRPLTWFVLLAVVLVSASVGPLLLGRDPGMLRVDAGTRAALAVMHALRAAVVVWILARAFHATPRSAAG